MADLSLTLEYEGETFEYAIDEIRTCKHCGFAWGPGDAPGGTCPNCDRGSGTTVLRGKYHFYIKQAWWYADPPATLDPYTAALRQSAKKLEALVAHGWEVIDADGEHLYFEGPVDPDANEYRVDSTLE